MSKFSYEATLKDLIELKEEIEKDRFIPRKFRKKPFGFALKKEYVNYLNKRIQYIKNKLSSLQ